MKKTMLMCLVFAAMALALGTAGCGVWMNPTYSRLLDSTAALSAETAKRADAGQLSQPEMVQALKLQAATWQLFCDARDGKASTPSASAAAPSAMATPGTK